MLTDQAREILNDKAFANLALVDDDGRPHVSPVWITVDDGDRLVVNTAEGRVKDRLLQPGAAVAVSATRPGNDYEHVLVRGRVVERTNEGADAVIDSLAKKYLDADTYPFRQPGEVRVTVTIEPD
jgi:PPOX class probable F420-dependent enzyme